MFSSSCSRKMLSWSRQLAAAAHHRPSTAAAAMGSVRYLNVHEYISMELFQSYGIKTPECKVASTPEEAENIYMNNLNKRTY